MISRKIFKIATYLFLIHKIKKVVLILSKAKKKSKKSIIFNTLFYTFSQRNVIHNFSHVIFT